MKIRKDMNIDPELLSTLTDEELKKYLMLKRGLEDLNLIVKEIESTYNKLSEENISDNEKKIQQARLRLLEYYLADINNQVNKALSAPKDNHKFS